MFVRGLVSAIVDVAQQLFEHGFLDCVEVSVSRIALPPVTHPLVSQGVLRGFGCISPGGRATAEAARRIARAFPV